MDLYLLRHAIAVDAGTGNFSEEERPLTKEGHEKMIAAVRGMKEANIKVEVLLSSPLKRAWQTAEVVKQYLPFIQKQKK